ncbi:Eco57I restriction-modification methylase domain-containing protein [Candidatus Marithrix sp. Canyon 246]|uniref:Eco57I restriction-modification methylase domain-containing protein n=1 Tax=Candidatus Marithrix sp. Canyon 246 TaxID=1827136 RepID=UPI00084A0FF4|nr:TaqI-like C-terminal specificity domain-containing protein [Candidatus Marithrix sp. Canyon 246]
MQNIDQRRVKGKISSQKLAKDYETCLNLLADITEQRTNLNQSRKADEELDLPFTPLHLYFADVFSGDNHGFDIVIANPPYVRQEQIKDIKPHLKEEFGKFFRGTADLYTYFYKRGLELLKTGGHLCFIAPNKFMRAGYGKNTRELLTTEATPEVIIDFGDSPVFDATTYPAIVLVEKTIEPVKEVPTIDVAIIKTKQQIEQVAEVVADHGFKMPVADLSIDGWTLESKEVLDLMKKLRQIGTPLGEYVQGRFYRGVLTGFNDAFVIDAATRDKLIAEDAKSAELIKPWLRGRDILKWQVKWDDLYVINIPSSANKEWLWSNAKTESEARQIFDKTYPAIHAHLSQWEPKLKKRNDQGKFFWELRSCAYYAEFEQPKIIWGNLAKYPKFAFDTVCNYISAPANLIPTEDLYLFAILNSKICKWLIERQAAVRSGDFLEFKPMYVAEIPICSVIETQKAPIIELVKTILDDPTAPDVRRLEAEIDELVFELYQLTEGERALVTES